MRESFKSQIKVNDDNKKIRALQLQRKFKNKEIKEEEIDYEDYENILKLYDEQNERLKKEIERYKKETEKIIKRKE